MLANARTALPLTDRQERIRAIIRGAVRVSDGRLLNDANTSLKADLRADDLACVTIVTECEESFGIAISDAELGTIDTLGDLDAIVTEKIQQGENP